MFSSFHPCYLVIKNSLSVPVIHSKTHFFAEPHVPFGNRNSKHCSTIFLRQQSSNPTEDDFKQQQSTEFTSKQGSTGWTNEPRYSFYDTVAQKSNAKKCLIDNISRLGIDKYLCLGPN
jgi:hypothetical protein